MKSILLTAWLAMNIFTFSLYGADKRKARRGAWRISEKTLLTCTWLFGGRGRAHRQWRVFRHKTKHRAFTVSAPIGRGNQHRGRIVRDDDVRRINREPI